MDARNDIAPMDEAMTTLHKDRPTFTGGIVKRAWVRNDTPPGSPAPGRINCPCKNAPETLYKPETGNITCNCGAVYTWNGWIITPPPSLSYSAA